MFIDWEEDGVRRICHILSNRKKNYRFYSKYDQKHRLERKLGNINLNDWRNYTKGNIFGNE